MYVHKSESSRIEIILISPKITQIQCNFSKNRIAVSFLVIAKMPNLYVNSKDPEQSNFEIACTEFKVYYKTIISTECCIGKRQILTIYKAPKQTYKPVGSTFSTKNSQQQTEKRTVSSTALIQLVNHMSKNEQYFSFTLYINSKLSHDLTVSFIQLSTEIA